jgi:hypothetical protein
LVFHYKQIGVSPVLTCRLFATRTSTLFHEPCLALRDDPFLDEGCRDALESLVVVGETEVGRARVGFRFNTISARGESYRVSTSSVVRQAPGTKKKDAAKIAIPAAAGAIIGGIADGKKGAAIGTAVGGGAGTGVVLATRGQEVRLGRGAAVSVRLLRPVTVLVPR